MDLMARYEPLLDRLLAALRDQYGARLVAVAVFGSVGRGTPREGSDVDVLIVVRDLPRGRPGRIDEFLPLERRLAPALRAAQVGPIPVCLSPVLKTPTEVEQGSPLFLDLVEDARILHDPDGFLAGYLEGLRARLRALGSRRIWRGATWYWDLKPDLKPGEVFTWP
jgi:predicted nucleotidyltransferase